MEYSILERNKEVVRNKVLRKYSTTRVVSRVKRAGRLKGRAASPPVKEKRPKPPIKQKLLLVLIAKLKEGTEMYIFFNVTNREIMPAFERDKAL